MTTALRRARASALPRVRTRELPPLERRFARATADYFRGMLPRVEPGIRRVTGRHSTKVDQAAVDRIYIELGTVSWDQETRILSRATASTYVDVASIAARAAVEDLGLEGSFDLGDYGIDDDVRGLVGTRIRQVTDGSRERIAREIADGIEKGLSVEQIVRGVPPGTTTIRGPVPAFRGVAGLVDSWSSTGTAGFAGAVGTVPLRSSRAYLIALTETGNAFNQAAIAGYRSSGLVDFVEVLDGPDCGWSSHRDPDLAHGSIRSLEAAQRQPLSHPRCQRAFGAALGATGPRSSPFQGRDPGNVPGATPGLRPDDIQPFGGRSVRIAPPAVRPSASVRRGSRQAEAAREAALEAAAERIRYTTTHETAIVVDAGGKVIVDKADPTKPRSVDFTDAEIATMRGGTLTHNHPGAYQTDLPYSTSFSPDDGRLLVFAGLREIRAVGKGADHVLRIRPGTFASEGALTYELGVLDKVVRADFSSEIASGRRTIKYAEADHWHEVWTRLAARVDGVEYERRFRPEKP
jgi:hypothetical protein